MIENIVWAQCWAISGGTFSFTVSVQGLNFRTVLAETNLSKVQMLTGTGHAKAAVLNATRLSGQPPPQSEVLDIFGFDGAPARWLSNCSRMTFGLEVNNAYAYMTARVYFFS